MIIESIIKEHNFYGIGALAHEHLYSAWMRDNTLHLYVLSSDKASVVIEHCFTARIEDGEIHLMLDGEAMTLYSHDELINTIRCAFPDNDDDWHDIITIIETLLYVE